MALENTSWQPSTKCFCSPLACVVAADLHPLLLFSSLVVGPSFWGGEGREAAAAAAAAAAAVATAAAAAAETQQ